MIVSLIKYASRTDQDFEEFRRKTLALVAENRTEAEKIPWVARMVESRKDR